MSPVIVLYSFSKAFDGPRGHDACFLPQLTKHSIFFALIWFDIALHALRHGLRVVWSLLERGIVAAFHVMQVVMVRGLHWIDIALHALRRGLHVVWSLLDRGLTAMFRYLRIGLIWVLDHLRDLLTALIHALQRALTRLAAVLISCGQAVKAGFKLMFHELAIVFKRSGDRLEKVRDNLLAGMR